MTIFYEKILGLCAAKGISLSKLNETMGLSNATATKWKKGAIPYNNTMFKLAQYFGIETDFLTDDRYMDYDEWLREVKGFTRVEDIRNKNLTQKSEVANDFGLDEEFLAMAKKLNDGQLLRVKDFIRGMLS